ncbi:MAG: hypothetical protein MUC99_11450 [Anaerolineae bacterium]|nr:hypothetical protein [Anaerolineae bacterium]
MPSFDLGALVIRLRATQPTPLTSHIGRSVQAAVLAALGEERAAQLQPRDNTDRPLPYTVSTVLADGTTTALSGAIPADAPAWVRVTGLTASACAALDSLAQHPPATLGLPEPWAVEGVTWDAPPWASTLTYRALMEAAYTQPQAPDSLHLLFATETTFRSSGATVAAPQPALIFGSLAEHWAACTGMPVREAKLWQAFTTYHIATAAQDITHHALKFRDGGKEDAFRGEALFELTPKNNALERDNPALEAGCWPITRCMRGSGGARPAASACAAAWGKRT